MKLRSALLAATMLAIPFAANAQPVTGLYVGAGAGVNVTQQEQVKNCTIPVAGARWRRHIVKREPQGKRGLHWPGFSWLGLWQRPPG